MGMLSDKMPAGGQPQGDVQQLIKVATRLLYTDNFKSLVKMFQTHGKEGFPQAMGMAINGVLERLEKETGGPLDQAVAAQVGAAIFEMLLQDLSEGGVLPDIDKQSVLLALEVTLQMWAKTHNVNQEEVKATLQQMAQEMMQSGELNPGDQVVPPSAMAQQGPPTGGQPVPGQGMPR